MKIVYSITASLLAGIRTWISGWDLAEGKGSMSYQQGVACTFMERFSRHVKIPFPGTQRS